MSPVIWALLACLAACFRSRRSIHLEILALRHQLAVYQRSVPKPRIRPADRLLWAWLARVWAGWQTALAFVQPRTVMRPGRPAVAKDLQDLIRRMSQANPTWGSPRLMGELRKLGIDVAKSTVERYRVRPRKPSSPPWKTFLKNHGQDLVSLDFCTVPTVAHKILFVLLILAHNRRRLVHFNITEHPTAQWTTQQVLEAFPWSAAPRYLLRDRDHIYGAQFQQRVRHMGIEEVVIAPHSPWQNPYVERLIGSIRCEVLDHVIVLHEPHLRRILTGYFQYYHRFRTHLSLAMDCPEPRPVHPPALGKVVAVPEVGGLHHHYERRAA